MKYAFLKCVVTLILWEVAANIEDNRVEDDFARDDCDVPQELRDEVHSYAPIVNKIISTAVSGNFKGKTWRSLAAFVDKFGNRIAGSRNLEHAIDYMVAKSNKMSLENVHTEEAQVPHWVRGKESATLLKPRKTRLPMLGLGSSVGTPPGGITASVVVVRTFDELQAKAEEVRGKIVVFNEEYESYGSSVRYRSSGASQASRVGAVAALVRSATPFSIASPHTGWQHYDDNVTQIPAACVTVEDAQMLQRMYDAGTPLVINIKMEAKNLKAVTSRNTVAEIIGYAQPDRVVVVSGHLDSWDVGQGAMDDGGGAFVSWNSLVLLKHLGLRARRTLRAILWTAEEEGLIGAQAYVSAHANDTHKLDFVLESDEGTFKPLGLGFSGSHDAGCVLQEVLKLLKPLNASQYSTPEDGGPDITLWTRMGVPGASLLNENQRYYWFHHSRGDTMAVEDSASLDMCTAVWTAVAYVVADLKADLPSVHASRL